MLESIEKISERVLFSINEAAELLGRSPKAVRRLCEKKRLNLSHSENDRRVFLELAEIERFKAEYRRQRYG